MRLVVFVPPLTRDMRALVPYYLGGLICNEATLAIETGAQRLAAELGLALLTPETRARDTGIERATGDRGFSEGARFRLDATTPGFAARFGMKSVQDCQPLLIRRRLRG